MSFQYFLIALFFIGSLIFLGRLFYTSFYSKNNSCGGNCGCSGVDAEKIEKEFLKRKDLKVNH